MIEGQIKISHNQDATNTTNVKITFDPSGYLIYTHFENHNCSIGLQSQLQILITRKLQVPSLLKQFLSHYVPDLLSFKM